MMKVEFGWWTSGTGILFHEGGIAEAAARVVDVIVVVRCRRCCGPSAYNSAIGARLKVTFIVHLRLRAKAGNLLAGYMVSVGL